MSWCYHATQRCSICGLALLEGERGQRTAATSHIHKTRALVCCRFAPAFVCDISSCHLLHFRPLRCADLNFLHSHSFYLVFFSSSSILHSSLLTPHDLLNARTFTSHTPPTPTANLTQPPYSPSSCSSWSRQSSPMPSTTMSLHPARRW